MALLVLGMAVLLSSAVRSREEKLCTGLDIQIGSLDQKGFVDTKEVAGILKDLIHTEPVGAALKEFNLRQAETALEQNVWIKDAQLYFDNKRVLHVEVGQRIPVARIVENTGSSYYLDSTGFRLPLSNTDRADVPVFTGVTPQKSNKLVEKIVAMAAYINADSFWLAQAAQIEVLPSGKFELYPTFGRHVVDLGNGANAAEKLGRVKAFYKTVSVRKGFDVYSKISVAYDRQVIAVRRDSAAPSVDAVKAVRVFDQIVKTNRTKANEQAAEFEKKQERSIPVNKVAPGNKSSDEKPPDIKNRGNPGTVEKNIPEQKPKAVMPKAQQN